MRHTRQTFLASGTAAAAAFALRPSVAAADLTALNITVTHYPEQDYALPIIVAQQNGFMAKQGLDIKSITGSSGGGTTVRNVAQGGLALGQVATPAAIKAILAGEDLKIIGGGVMTAGTISWSVKKSSPIKTIHDLVGKSVGFTQPGSASESLLALSLRAANIDPSTVKTRAAGGIGENYALLMSGDLDAVFTVDPLLTQKANEIRVVFFAREYVPHFMQSVWVTDSGTLHDKSTEVAAFMRGWTYGVNYIDSHISDSARMFAKATSADYNVVLTTLQHEQPAQYFGKGDLNREALATAVEGMRIGKLLGPDKLDVGKLIDQSALASNMRTSLPATM
ncbi:MAG TPA: ABC transporter substrate-binding protein [Candidatus Acidoferrales bacterium]|nr:ABC transporter substrate-binding protein [Candidatus Acidoferrales bacterium]